ncbi:MAG: hypothetical protein ACHQJ4_06670, partial [Ignavibacteria bacterium]
KVPNVDNTIVKAFKDAESIATKIGKIFDDGAENVVSSFQTALGYVQDMVSLVKSISDMVSIFDSILSFVPGGGVIAGILGGGGRAGGGPVNSAIPYLVGELGPEIFIPDTSGFISPLDTGSSFINTMNNEINSGDYITSVPAATPEITVIVQSEVERSKAMKFFSNHFPQYQNRQDKGNLR